MNRARLSLYIAIEMSITYPPELLPTPDEDDEVEVIVVDPKTGEEVCVSTIDAALSEERIPERK